MKFNFPQQSVLKAVLFGAGLLAAHGAVANSTFNASATVTFTINSITNLNPDHPGDLSGLEILGSFQQPNDASHSFAFATGDGTVTANNPDVLLTPVSGSFSRSFAVSGAAGTGTLDTFHTGWFTLDLNAVGADSYAVDIDLSYQIDAAANGIFANSALSLDYGYTGSAFSGSDAVVAGTFEGVPVDAMSLPGLQSLSLVIGPNAFESVFADVGITGNLQPVATVPVPAAVWLLASGLAGLGFTRRRA